MTNEKRDHIDIGDSVRVRVSHLTGIGAIWVLVERIEGDIFVGKMGDGGILRFKERNILRVASSRVVKNLTDGDGPLVVSDE